MLLRLLEDVGHLGGQAARILLAVGHERCGLDSAKLGELGGDVGEDLGQVRQVRPDLLLVVALVAHGEGSPAHLVGRSPVGRCQPLSQRIRYLAGRGGLGLGLLDFRHLRHLF